MNPKTFVRSMAMRRFSSLEHLEAVRRKAIKRRQSTNPASEVLYFHQVDDPYSHLAVQKLTALSKRYRLPFKCYLVSAPDPTYQGSSQHFSSWAMQDAINVAPDYGVKFAPLLKQPGTDQIAAANHALAACRDTASFASEAFKVGQALWNGESVSSPVSAQTGEQALALGNELRQSLQHYQGAMFYFDGEWFWGLDRIRSLETRLIAEGFGSGPLVVPEPVTPGFDERNLSGITLEYFPSLRSPYTAIGHQRVVDLVRRSGVDLKVRPVMPMLMRGIPAPQAKQRYIITDAGREGRERGTPFGKIVDPFGEPVKRAFALFPAADALERGMDYVTAYLEAAWFDGVDVTRESGLKRVVKNAGLDWLQLNKTAGDYQWQAQLQSNLDAMLEENLWGVPSFRVSGGGSDHAFACWGQDRIWRVAKELLKRT